MRWLVTLALFLATGCNAAPTPKGGMDWELGKEQRAMVAQIDLPQWVALVSLNTRINHSMTYESDWDQYHKAEWWVANPKSNKGDCEDYALTKISEIISSNLGPKVGFRSTRISVVQVLISGGKAVTETTYHAVAVWKDSQGNEWVLDNCCDVPFTKHQLEVGTHGMKYVWLWP